MLTEPKQETQLDVSSAPLKLNLMSAGARCNFPCMASKQLWSCPGIGMIREETRLLRPGRQGLL